VTREDEEKDDDMSYPGGVSPDVPKIPCPPAAPEVSTHDVDCTCALCYLPLKADRVHPAVTREEVVEWYSNRMTTSDFLEAVRRSWLALESRVRSLESEQDHWRKAPTDLQRENAKLRKIQSVEADNYTELEMKYAQLKEENARLRDVLLLDWRH
jgi:hypothetical protein